MRFWISVSWFESKRGSSSTRKVASRPPSLSLDFSRDIFRSRGILSEAEGLTTFRDEQFLRSEMKNLCFAQVREVLRSQTRLVFGEAGSPSGAAIKLS